MTNETRDRIRGVLFGQAVGDALGLGTEFMPREEARRIYPGGLRDYGQIVDDAFRKGWPKGAWSDDTDMMLCIAEAMASDGDILPQSVARNFKEWFKTSPKGIGRHTSAVLSSDSYEADPAGAAEAVWKLSGRRSAANGGVMRTSVVGLWKHEVASHAERICRLTHADPRCIGSCVIVSEVVHHWVWHGIGLPFSRLLAMGVRYDARIRPCLEAAKEASLESLGLDEKNSMGYTLKTLSAALWCLFHARDFEEGLLAVVNAGGDADTNAAVACSLLGAKYGFGAIPSRYVERLAGKERLESIAARLIALLEGA